MAERTAVCVECDFPATEQYDGVVELDKMIAEAREQEVGRG